MWHRGRDRVELSPGKEMVVQKWWCTPIFLKLSSYLASLCQQLPFLSLSVNLANTMWPTQPAHLIQQGNTDGTGTLPELLGFQLCPTWKMILANITHLQGDVYSNGSAWSISTATAVSDQEPAPLIRVLTAVAVGSCSWPAWAPTLPKSILRAIAAQPEWEYAHGPH